MSLQDVIICLVDLVVLDAFETTQVYFLWHLRQEAEHTLACLAWIPDDQVRLYRDLPDDPGCSQPASQLSYRHLRRAGMVEYNIRRHINVVEH